MKPLLVRRELLNVAFLAFIPAGETVDTVTVSATTWPDNNPLTNWTDYQIPDVETLKLAKEYDTETFKIPLNSGGYQDDEDTLLKKVTLAGTTAKTSSYFKQLEYGLASAPAAGVAQAPWVTNDDFLEGVALIEFQNKSGTVTERVQIWCRLRLTNPGDVGPATRKLEFSLEKRSSGNNTYVRVA